MQSERTDTAEIELLYRTHGPSLLLFATAITGERSRAQDAIHQVFLKLLKDGIRDVADAKAYLFTCVRNIVLSDEKYRHRNVELAEESTWFAPSARDYTAELNLRRALRALPEDQRLVTVLHLWSELTFSQIASVLGISSNTAASRYRYALAKLRESMCAKEDSCANTR